MCLMHTRVHRCRHCTYRWSHPDHLDLCPEGEKLLLQHGHLCDLHELLASAKGHRISQDPALTRGWLYSRKQVEQVQTGYGKQPKMGYALKGGEGGGGGGGFDQDQGQKQEQIQDQDQKMFGYYGKEQERDMEDMCEECKGRHMREWADEARGRVAVQVQEPEQVQIREGHCYYPQNQHLAYHGGNVM